VSDASLENVVGYSVYARGVAACANEIAEAIARGEPARWLACLNPHSFAVARETPPFQAALRNADWLIPDGAGIVLASRLLQGAIRERVTGADVFHGLNQRMNDRGGGRVFFIGSTEKTLAAIRDRMAIDYPRVEVVGTYSPPFKPDYSDAEIDEMVATINAAKPDVLWVGMTAPKQEIWIHRVRERLDVKFAAAIGAVFDFYTGRIKRSPAVFQQMGLEWLPRLLQEPRRLWRRTFVSAPIFLAHVVRQRIGSALE
jgi:N-acetylglucosaminyldiphosphoundecaprenol N-acetyl-beta-D-mannosaminyltransferase